MTSVLNKKGIKRKTPIAPSKDGNPVLPDPKEASNAMDINGNASSNASGNASSDSNSSKANETDETDENDVRLGSAGTATKKRKTNQSK